MKRICNTCSYFISYFHTIVVTVDFIYEPAKQTGNSRPHTTFLQTERFYGAQVHKLSYQSMFLVTQLFLDVVFLLVTYSLRTNCFVLI